MPRVRRGNKCRERCKTILALAGFALTMVGCGGSTGPSDTPEELLPRDGNYVLTLRPSTTCSEIPSASWEWDVVVTRSSSGAVATLPGGRADVSVQFFRLDAPYVAGVVVLSGASVPPSDGRMLAPVVVNLIGSFEYRSQQLAAGGFRDALVDGTIVMSWETVAGDGGSGTCRAGNHLLALRSR